MSLQVPPWYIFNLLILFQIKHFIADYPLQTSYMLGKFKGGTDWILPLLAYCLVHSVFTFIILVCFTGNPNFAFDMTLFDFGMHGIMDRIKASPRLMGRWKPLTAKDYPAAD